MLSEILRKAASLSCRKSRASVKQQRGKKLIFIISGVLQGKHRASEGSASTPWLDDLVNRLEGWNIMDILNSHDRVPLLFLMLWVMYWCLVHQLWKC